jgi:hypothetical protein
VPGGQLTGPVTAGAYPEHLLAREPAPPYAGERPFAQACADRLSDHPSTSSPGASSVTSGPISTTRPAPQPPDPHPGRHRRGAPGGPATRAAQQQVHQIIQQLINRGRAEGTIRNDVTPRDIVALGAMLAQPGQSNPDWDATCRRLLATYLAGLSTQP